MKLTPQEKAIIDDVQNNGPMPLPIYGRKYGSVIRAPLNEYLKIQWPQGAQVSNGFSHSTPVVVVIKPSR